jgi:hypothetical protein
MVAFETIALQGGDDGSKSPGNCPDVHENIVSSIKFCK